MILADELLDLALVVLAFVQGDADRPVGRDHRLAEQPGRLPLDVEIFLLLEPEQRPIELAPHAHLPAPDIMSQMVEQVQADIVLRRRLPPAGKLRPIGIKVFAVLDEIEIGTADPLDDGIVLVRRRSEEHTSELQSLMRISYAVFCLKNKNKS